jgi:hypothetical protein
VQQNILWFDISVHNVAFSEHFEGVGELLKVEQTLLLRQIIHFLQNFLQSSTIAVFVDEIEVVLCLHHVDVFDDVPARFERTQNIDFVECAFF